MLVSSKLVFVLRIFILYSLFLYDAVLSMAPYIRLCFQHLCACLSTSLPFPADGSFQSLPLSCTSCLCSVLTLSTSSI